MSKNYLRGGLAAILATAALSQAALAQPGPPGHHGHRRHCPPPQLIQKSGQQLVLGQDGWRKLVNYDASTKFSREGKPVTADQVHEGDAVRVRDQVQPDGTLLAIEVRVDGPPPVHGRLVTKGDGGFLIDSHHELVRVDLSPSTKFYYGFLPVSPSGILAGMHLGVEGKMVGANRIEADSVHAHLPWGAMALGLALSGGVAVYAHKRRKRNSKPSPQTDIVPEVVPHGVND
jgi:hypothetical protein